jgi:phosphoserine phosphatase
MGICMPQKTEVSLLLCRRLYVLTSVFCHASFSWPQSFASQTGLAIDHAKKVLKSADAVAFDVDSTVIVEEGIDRLADFLGQGKAVAELTAR